MTKTFNWWGWGVVVVVFVILGAPNPILVQCEGELGKIYDITHKLEEGMAVFGSVHGSGPFVNETWGTANYYGVIKLNTHLGTHVDSPAHFYKDLLLAGFDVESLDLHTLNGPVLVVDTPKDSNITAKVLQSLNIPKEQKRVIFKTLNTYSGLMQKSAFTSNYTGFTTDGAEWLVKNTNIKLVGIDYMSVATNDEVVTVHKVLLGPKDIIPVENLKLDEVNPGSYTIHCLPLRLAKADGSPARCILVE